MTPTATKVLAVLRVATGFIFLSAFLDKTFGLGHATSQNAWIIGGSPTKDYLSRVAVGPFESLFHSWAGAAWADWLFMLGLLGIGVALILGVALRLAAVARTIQLVLMWAAEWPAGEVHLGGRAEHVDQPDRRVLRHLRAGADRTCGGVRRQHVGFREDLDQAAIRTAQPLSHVTRAWR
jgi:thiosulfate dehydrogenase [quinone] large subunit